MKKKTFHAELVNRLKCIGQDLIDGAEEIAPPDGSLITNLTVTCYICSDGALSSVPSITVSTSVLSKKFIGHLQHSITDDML